MSTPTITLAPITDPLLQQIIPLATAFADTVAAKKAAEQQAVREQEWNRQEGEAARVIQMAKQYIDSHFTQVLSPVVLTEVWSGAPSFDGGHTAEACAVIQLDSGMWLRFAESPAGEGTEGYLLLVAVDCWGGYREHPIANDADFVSALDRLASLRPAAN